MLCDGHITSRAFFLTRSISTRFFSWPRSDGIGAFTRAFLVKFLSSQLVWMSLCHIVVLLVNILGLRRRNDFGSGFFEFLRCPKVAAKRFSLTPNAGNADGWIVPECMLLYLILFACPPCSFGGAFIATSSAPLASKFDDNDGGNLAISVNIDSLSFMLINICVSSCALLCYNKVESKCVFVFFIFRLFTVLDVRVREVC